jgi:hypothetical protein
MYKKVKNATYYTMGSAGFPMDTLMDGAKTIQDLVAWELSSG